MPLRAIAYISRALPELSSQRLQALVERCAFQQDGGVTGVLLHDGNRFLQYIEGRRMASTRCMSAFSRPAVTSTSSSWREPPRPAPVSYWSMRALPVEAALLRQLSSSDWAGFSRALEGIARRRHRSTCWTRWCSRRCMPADIQPHARPQ